MIIHYLRLSWKAITKYKYHSLINVFGLASGMLGALVIAKYIGGSLQFDSFLSDRKKIHAISQQESIGGRVQKERPGTYQGVADIVKQFPEALRTTKYMQHVESLILPKNDGIPESFTEAGIFISDSNFFNIFSFPFLHGNPATALSRANSVVLTEATASKYFDHANPIGRAITIRTSWGQETTYEVTGVARDIPMLSQFTFDLLINGPPANEEELWNLPDYSIFVLLGETTNAADLAKKVTARLRDVPELHTEDKKLTLELRALSDVRLSNTEYLLATVAIMIVIVCWTNYINQCIGQTFWRTKQLGVLTVLGASKANMRTQFVVESGLICGAAFVLVIVSYALLENWLQSLTNSHFLPLIGDTTPINLIFITIFLVGMTLASLTPTFILFRQNLEKILRNSFIPNVGGIAIRKVFVAVQFSISTILIVGIFVVVGQLDFMKRKDKGMNMDNVLIIKAPMGKDTTWAAKIHTLQLFKQRVSALPFVQEVTSSTTVPSEEYRQETFLSVQGDDNRILVHQNGVDENFFSLYDVQFVAGHDFIPDGRAKNRESIILNESAARSLGFDPNDLINLKIIDHENPDIGFNVIGVVRDYHQTSPKFEIRPLAFKYNLTRGHCSIRIDPAHLNQASLYNGITSLKDLWKQSYPDASFDYFFLYDKYQAQDQEDQYFGSLFQAFTILSVILSCLGLFGLSILISAKRQKEVGVRKTFGATSLDILTLFMKGYSIPLGIALVSGSACAYFLMSEWLKNYANRIEIGPGLILTSTLALVIIFVGTVSYHTIAAARANPANVLRN